MSLITMEHLHLSFTRQGQTHMVIKDVSLQLNKGELLALVGESGSGKSLSALSMLGLQPASASIRGTIRYAGKTVLSGSQFDVSLLNTLRGNRVGVIFQEPMSALNPLHTIAKQLTESVMWHQKLRGTALREKTHKLLCDVGLTHLEGRLSTTYPHELSGGERQRLMIGMAIANDPDVLIADEPTTALDVTLQAQVLSLLKKLQKERHMAVLMITHDLSVVRRVADRVAVMRRGEVVETGPTARLFATPQHDYTRMLIDAEPEGSPAPIAADAPLVVASDGLAVRYPIRGGILKRLRGYVEAVKPTKFALREGETLGLVGESGSGKSSLGNAILRLVESDGPILFCGEDISRRRMAVLRPLRKDMQLVFQDPYGSLNPRLSVGAIIREGLEVHYPKRTRADNDREVAAMLRRVGLEPEMRHRYPHEFSGGQRQRIAVARAMILKPKLVVLDEPTSALDMSVQKQVLSLLRELQNEEQTAYILISHDLRVIRAMAHQVMVMRNGDIVESGTATALFEAPEHDYTKALMDAAFAKTIID
jgi:microcin C transport system ATP-binding protein